MTDKTTTTAAGKWMPEEYTREMYTAFWDAEAGQGCIRFADAYSALLRAAPSPAPADPSAAQDDALTMEREFNGQLLAMLKQMFDAPTMAAGYAILADFAAQFYPGTPVALQPSQGGSVSEAVDALEQIAALAERLAAGALEGDIGDGRSAAGVGMRALAVGSQSTALTIAEAIRAKIAALRSGEGR